MTASITFDPTATAYLTSSGTEWCAARHVLIDCSWIQWAREVTGKDTLFVYFHKHEGTFVLANWIIGPDENRGPGLMTELEVLNGHPDRGGARHIDRTFLNARCMPLGKIHKKIKDRVVLLKKARQQQRDEEESERIKVARWLRKKMGNHTNVPDLLAAGALEWAKPTDSARAERFKEIVKDLRGRA